MCVIAISIVRGHASTLFRYNMAKYLSLFILLLLLPDLYIWFFHTRALPSVWSTLWVVLPTVVTLACIAYSLLCPGASLAFNAFFALLICVAVPKLMFVVVDLVGLGLGNVWPAFRLWGTRLALVAAALMMAVQLYGTFFGWKQLRVNKMRMMVNGLPSAFDGYRVVHLSDLHVGTYAKDDSFLRRMVDSVNACHPDLIVFTGDLVNATSAELSPYLDALSGLKAKDGVVSVLGNHDYCIYGTLPLDKRRKEVRNIIEMQHSLGWKVLLNEHLTLRRGDDSLVVAGVENVSRPPRPQLGRLDKAMHGVSETTCTILLSHDPWHWKNGVLGHYPNIALTLSGHTHALQMQVGSFSPAQWISSEWGGLYKHGKQRIYVSTGIGGAVLYRLGAWPCIESYTLRRE